MELPMKASEAANGSFSRFFAPVFPCLSSGRLGKAESKNNPNGSRFRLASFNQRLVKTLGFASVFAIMSPESLCHAAEQPDSEGMTVEAASGAKAKEVDMTWWHDAKFGLFITWGVYAVPGVSEWVMNQQKIPVATYKEYAKEFNPVKYDPNAWVQMAKNAGMKYIVITAKHHDGFALFDTKASNWNMVQATPYGKDLLKPLAEACRKNGIKLGFYYSQSQDWSNGGTTKGGNWDPAQNRDMDDYIDKVVTPQVRELLTQYGEGIPAILWWDTPQDMTEPRVKRVLNVVNELQPNVIQNNRLGKGYPGNYKTPENFVPVSGVSGDWETCMTMNRHWGYSKNDHNWKSAASIIQILANIASKGGNFLLNVGPTPEGEIPQPSVERLQAIGQWMKVNGESIYGTQAGPFATLSWGCATRKGDRLYLHVFKWPKDGVLRVPLLSNAKAAWMLSAPDQKLEIAKEEKRLTIKVPATAPDESDAVVVLKLDGEPKTAPLPTIGAVATASAAQPGNGPENLFDGSRGKRWVAPQEIKSASVEIDLGREQEISGYGFDEPDVWPRVKQTFTLEALVGESWKKVAEGKTQSHGSAGVIPTVNARKFRLTMECENGGPGVAELQLYRPE